MSIPFISPVSFSYAHTPKIVSSQEKMEPVPNQRQLTVLSNYYYAPINLNKNQNKFLSQPRLHRVPSFASNAASSPLKSIKTVEDLYKITSNSANMEKFMDYINENPEKTNKITKSIISRVKPKNFITWYTAPNGYLNAYGKYLDNYYKKAKSVDDLLKLMPNWGPWKLEDKYLATQKAKRIKNTPISTSQEKQVRNDRAVPLEIGSIPELFDSSKDEYQNFVQELKHITKKKFNIKTQNNIYSVKHLNGGVYSDKGIYLVSRGDNKAIIKCDNITLNNVGVEKEKNIRKNTHLKADSNYINACLTRYLNLNNCPNVPELMYYDHQNFLSVFSYVKADDKFQLDKNYQCDVSLKKINSKLKGLNDLGVYINDTSMKNVLKDSDGAEKVIDLGHANFINPLKPGIKHYNIIFPNISGYDIASMQAGIMLNMTH
jgi:hypothetical protein